jgi:hypothetical protein
MVCATSCSIAVVFLVANLYVTFTADHTKLKAKFYGLLNAPEIKRYETIIAQRRRIYLEGYALGLVLSAIVVYCKYTKSLSLSSVSVVCLVGAITLLTNYFYYMLAPKDDYMVLHLNAPEQRLAWQEINRKMQVKYHVGLLLGIVAAMFFGRGCTKV